MEHLTVDISFSFVGQASLYSESLCPPYAPEYGKHVLQEVQPLNNALVQCVDEETRAELRLEPGALGWHQQVGVSDVHELLNGRWVEREGDDGFAIVHAPF